MAEFRETDNGPAPDRWPHTDADVLPSIKVTMYVGPTDVGHAVVAPSRKRFVNLFIRPEHRGRGHGEELFCHVLDHYDITNFSVAPYDGLESFSRLMAMHERRGFVPSHAVEMVKKQ